MKKKLNVDSISNELEGASLFFAKPQATLPLPEKSQTLEIQSPAIEIAATGLHSTDSPTAQVQNEENQYQNRTDVRPYVRTNVRFLSKKGKKSGTHSTSTKISLWPCKCASSKR